MHSTPVLEQLIYLPEGQMSDLGNYSGTPYYFGRSLMRLCEELGIEFVLVEVPEMINTEPLWKIVAATRFGSQGDIDRLLSALTPEQREHTAARRLLNCLHKGGEWPDARVPIAEYVASFTEITSGRVADKVQSRAAVLALNTYNPPCETSLPLYYYLDTPLFPFYFAEEDGLISTPQSAKTVLELFRIIECNAVKRAAGIFFFSRYAADRCASSYTNADFAAHVVGAGCNLEESPFYPTRQSETQLRILFVGRDFEIKGGAILMEAAARLDPERFALTVVTDQRFHPRVTDRIPPCVRFLPPCGKSELIELYRKHDVFVFPTRLDAFGLVVVEAMLHAMAVLASPVRAIPEIVGQDLDGFDPFVSTADELVTKLECLESERSLIVELGRSNYLRAKTAFRWKFVTAAILSVILKNRCNNPFEVSNE